MDDWQVGDLALCVAGTDHVPQGFEERAPNECPPIYEVLAPTPGSKWTVTAVEIHYRLEERQDLAFLGLRGQSSGFVFDARLFRKIRPHEADAEDAETIALLNSQTMPVDA